MTALKLILIVVVVLVNGFFVAAEFALVGVRRSRIAGQQAEALLHVVAFIIAYALLTSLHITVGEQAPKLFGLQRAERVALWSALPMEVFYKTFRWPIHALDWASARMVRLFGLHASSSHASIYTEEEIRQIIEMSHKGGHLEADERRLINRV